MRNYHDINFILNMEIPDFISQVSKLKEKELEKRIWEIWLARYPTMTQDDYISYEDMLNAATQKEVPVSGCYVDQVLF